MKDRPCSCQGCNPTTAKCGNAASTLSGSQPKKDNVNSRDTGKVNPDNNNNTRGQTDSNSQSDLASSQKE